MPTVLDPRSPIRHSGRRSILDPRSSLRPPRPPAILEPRSIRFLLLCAPAATAHAAASEPALEGGLLQATLGLALVLGLIVAVAWIAKRFAPGAVRGGMPLTIVASQAVGQRERVVVVEVADQWLVIGVAPGRVSPLTTLPKGAVPVAAAPMPPFAQALARALGRRD